MTPQSNFMVVAKLRGDAKAALDGLLNEMNYAGSPGMADPDNALFPFGAFDNLHYARFVIVDDKTLIDFKALGLPIPRHSLTLAFLGDCDGPVDDLFRAFASNPVALDGLKKVFGHCEGFGENTDLVSWMKANEHPPAAAYVNWTGRTVRQIRSEATLRDALHAELGSYQTMQTEPRDDVSAIRRHLRNFVAKNPELMPPPEPDTPTAWLIANLLHFAILPAALLLPWALALVFLTPISVPLSWVMVPFAVIGAIAFFYILRRANLPLAILALFALFLIPLLVLFPIMLIAAILAGIGFILVLRCYEKNEPEIIPSEPVARMDRHIASLAEREDLDVTNQFTVIGSLKPGLFRRWLSSLLLWLIDYGARHIYNRGHIGRIQSIHFARWTFVDDKQRLIFASNYDGTTEAYMDDFINKVGWGLNLAFGGGVGYPRVNWLILDGAKEEQKFKYTLRRHQLPTEVWYKAYPGLTAYDLARNARVHEGIMREQMNDDEISAWLRDL